MGVGVGAAVLVCGGGSVGVCQVRGGMAQPPLLPKFRDRQGKCKVTMMFPVLSSLSAERVIHASKFSTEAEAGG